MGTTQYYTATSVDGFIADEHNSLDWLFQVPAGDDDVGHEDQVRSLPRRRRSDRDGVDDVRVGRSSTTSCSSIPRSGAATTATRRAGCSRTGSSRRSTGPICGSCKATWSRSIGRWSTRQTARTSGSSGAGSWSGSSPIRVSSTRSSSASPRSRSAPALRCCPGDLLASDLTLVSVERHGQFVSATYRVGRT